MKTIRPIRRRQGPTISWIPASDSYSIVAGLLRSGSALPLHAAQSAIVDLEARLATDPAQVSFGLLVGAWCITPDTHEEYLLVDEVIPGRGELSSSDPVAELAAQLRALAAASTSRKRLVLGWYLGGMDDDLQLDADTQRLHTSLFPEPWQVLLLRNAPSSVQRGGFFRYARMSDRFYSVPFFELLPEGQRSPGDPRTAVRWSNYRAGTTVQPLANSPTHTDSPHVTPSRHREPQADPLTRAVRWTRERVGKLGSERVAAPQHANVTAATHGARTSETSARVQRDEATAVPEVDAAVGGPPVGSGTADADVPPAPVQVTFPALLPETEVTMEPGARTRRTLLLIAVAAVVLLLVVLLFFSAR
jgi:hypothetical protein